MRKKIFESFVARDKTKMNEPLLVYNLYKEKKENYFEYKNEFGS